MNVIETILGRLSSSILGYFHLWDYFDSTAHRIVSRRKTHNVQTCLDFYQQVQRGEIKHGDRVKLEGFFASEWIPRFAGACAAVVGHTRTAGEYYSDSVKSIAQSILMPPNNIIPAAGSIRMPLEEGKRIILGAVSEEEYRTDYGVVLSVSESIYSSFLSKQLKNSAVEVSLEGYVELYNSPIGIPSIENSALATTSAFSQIKCLIRVDSPLQIRFRHHDSHPALTAWVIRQVDFSDTEHGYDYSQITVGNDVEELRMARDILNAGIQHKALTHIVNCGTPTKEFLGKVRDLVRYQTRAIKGSRCLTEFDGRNQSVNPLIPFSTDPRLNPDSLTLMSQFLKEILTIEKQKRQQDEVAMTLIMGKHIFTHSHALQAQLTVPSCPFCNALIFIRTSDPKVKDFKNDMSVPFPEDNKLKCPTCNTHIDLSELRKVMETLQRGVVANREAISQLFQKKH